MGSQFDYCSPRRGTNCYKWDYLMMEYGREDLLPYWIADMEFATLPAIQKALAERINRPVYSYTFPDDGFFRSISAWYRNRHHVQVAQEEIFPLPGIVLGIGRIIETFTERGDKVILNTPVYDSYADMIPRLGREIADVPLLYKGGRYLLNLEGIEQELQNGAKAYVFCSPHNPVGRVWTEEEIAQVAALCDQYHVPLISDEIHSDIVFKGFRHRPAFDVSEAGARCAIVLNSTAKTFNTASLKAAYLVSKNPEYFAKAKESVALYHAGVSFLGYLATKTAYEQGGQWVDELNEYLEENARFVCRYLREHLPQVKTYVPEGTFLMWLDFRAFGMTQEKLMRFLTETARIALSSGISYGPAAVGFARLNIGCPRTFLEAGLERLVDAAASVK